MLKLVGICPKDGSYIKVKSMALYSFSLYWWCGKMSKVLRFLLSFFLRRWQTFPLVFAERPSFEKASRKLRIIFEMREKRVRGSGKYIPCFQSGSIKMGEQFIYFCSFYCFTSMPQVQYGYFFQRSVIWCFPQNSYTNVIKVINYTIFR